MDVKKLMDELHSAESPSEKKAVEEKIRQEFDSLSDAEKTAAKKSFSLLVDEQVALATAKLKDIDLAIELAEISKYISLSAVAKDYFGKSREWFYQRVKGYNVNGKPARFNANELQTLSLALNDISQKAYQTSRRIS
jgi:hypothetical protein